MAKITIPDILSSFASVTQINNYFQRLEDELNNKVLYRDNPLGEPNSLQGDIDLNSNDLLNVNNVSANTITVAGSDLTASVTAAINASISAIASAAAAANSEGNAATQAALAAASFDEFDDLYLGSYASDPTVDNDGDPIQIGALYFNTVANGLRVYTGSVWNITTASASNVAYTPSGFLTAVDVQSALDEVAIIDASKIINTPAGSISATDLQAAIDELDTVKLSTSGKAADSELLDGIDSLGFVWQTAVAGAANLPTGTTAQRPAAPVEGMFRRNTETSSFEGYTGTAWAGVGGASGGAGNPVFYENDITVTTDYTITSGKNASSTGPLTINTGVVVTVPPGSTWVIL